MSKTSVDEIKLGGAKRKNGHKSNCTCHICENMTNKAKRGGYQEELNIEQEKKMGVSKKKNGHRKDCNCPICKNMKNSKKGGDDVDFEKEEEEESIDFSGGKRKKKGNGHKANCKCPICKNIYKSKRGGDIEEGIGDDNETVVPSQTVVQETPASSDEYDDFDAAERGESVPNKVGGTRKHRKRGGKKWAGKTRRTRKNRHSRRRR